MENVMTTKCEHKWVQKTSCGDRAATARFAFDSEYVQRLADGDSATQQHFVAYFSPLLFVKIRARVRSLDFVDDIMQDTFLRVFTTVRREGIKQPECLGAFVSSVCNNVLFEYNRRNNKAAQLDTQLDVVDTRCDVDRTAQSNQRKQIARVVLGQLPQKEGSLLRRIFLEGCDADLLCKEYGVTRDYLRVMVHRALKRAQLVTRAMSCA
jgi:RNA polymerase sigma-70 factor (ECF subfamily)